MNNRHTECILGHIRILAPLRCCTSAAAARQRGDECERYAQETVNYKPEQREALLAAQDALFMRMHEVLEKREAIVNTLQTNFPCAETEHKNAPLYVQVSARPAAACSLLACCSSMDCIAACWLPGLCLASQDRMSLAVDVVLPLCRHGNAAQQTVGLGCGYACGSVKAHAEGWGHGTHVDHVSAHFT